MTTKPASHPEPGKAPQAVGKIIPFPDAPPDELTAYYAINNHGYPPSLAAHFGSRETTIITSEVAAALIPYEGTYEGVRYPDLLIAFNVNPEANKARKGLPDPRTRQASRLRAGGGIGKQQRARRSNQAPGLRPDGRPRILAI